MDSEHKVFLIGLTLVISLIVTVIVLSNDHKRQVMDNGLIEYNGYLPVEIFTRRNCP